MTGVADHPLADHPLAGLLTVMWHYVRDAGEPPFVGRTGVDPGAFDRQLDLLAARRSVVGWPAVATALAGGPTLPPDAALLTFDDGLADHARTVLPKLQDRGWPAVFFVLARSAGEPLTVGHAIHVLLGALGDDGLRSAVMDALPAPEARRFAALEARERASGVGPIDALKRPLQRDLLDRVEPILQALVRERVGPSGEIADALHLSASEIGRMRRAGFTIGGHGRRHLWFDHEPSDRVAGEIAASAGFLAGEPRPWVFAYPFGASGPAVADQLAAAGFAAAFHASPRIPGGPFHLGRIDGEAAGFESMITGSGS